MLQIAGLLASVAAVVLTAALAILPLRTLLSITRNLGWTGPMPLPPPSPFST